jgi:hypothetical protein
MHVRNCAEDFVQRRLPQRVHDRGGIATTADTTAPPAPWSSQAMVR